MRFVERLSGHSEMSNAFVEYAKEKVLAPITSQSKSGGIHPTRVKLLRVTNADFKKKSEITVVHGDEACRAGSAAEFEYGPVGFKFTGSPVAA